MKNAASSEIWKSRVEEFLKTNKTQASWCKENNYAPKTFSYWFRRFKDQLLPIEKTKVNFIPIKVQNEIPPTPVPSIVIKIAAATIEVRSGFDAKLLQEVVKSLEAIC
ncbi:MAG: hypothetical protein N3E37_05570 [Candidatus Micrarchaeota archaeon]|nr:hypothetical protein [Candidatus Micrarchaeota archaeon]